MLLHFSYKSEVDKRFFNAVIIYMVGHIVGSGLGLVGSIAHSHADPGKFKHIRIF